MYIFFVVPLLVISLISNYLFPKKPKSVKSRHVVITGGSSGIGKSIAILLARQGANITIIARNIDRLTQAETEIKMNCINDNQIVTKKSVDVSNYEEIKKVLNEIDTNVGPIFMLVNCAGFAISRKFENYSVEEIKQLFDVNFMGTAFPIKALIPKFKQRKEGIIVLTASQVALMGMFGYSVYSSCKFALRGLAESINMELKPYKVSVTVALPPDTDTPGFEMENKTKPPETRIMSETGGLYSPNDVAEKIIKDALVGKFFSYVGCESYLLTTLCIGMSQYASVAELMIQTCLLGPFRLIAAYYMRTFEKIVKNNHVDKDEKVE